MDSNFVGNAPPIEFCEFRRLLSPAMLWCDKYLQLMDGTAQLCYTCQTTPAYREELQRRLKEFDDCHRDPHPDCPIFHVEKSQTLCDGCRASPEERIKVAQSGLYGFFKKPRMQMEEVQAKIGKDLENIVRELEGEVSGDNLELETIRLAISNLQKSWILKKI